MSQFEKVLGYMKVTVVEAYGRTKVRARARLGLGMVRGPALGRAVRHLARSAGPDCRLG